MSSWKTPFKVTVVVRVMRNPPPGSEVHCPRSGVRTLLSQVLVNMDEMNNSACGDVALRRPPSGCGRTPGCAHNTIYITLLHRHQSAVGSFQSAVCVAACWESMALFPALCPPPTHFVRYRICLAHLRGSNYVELCCLALSASIHHAVVVNMMCL